jgi:hypothetical protein
MPVLVARSASVDEVEACLKTVEGVNWSMSKEERAAKADILFTTI